MAGSESQRRHGALWNTKMLSGVVERVETLQGKRKENACI